MSGSNVPSGASAPRPRGQGWPWAALSWVKCANVPAQFLEAAVTGTLHEVVKAHICELFL